MPGNHRKWHDGGVWRSTCLFDSAWCNLTALAESDFVAIGNDETSTEWESAWPKDSRFGRSMSERLQQFGRRQGNEAHCSAFQEKVAAYCSCSILDPSASQWIPSSDFIPLHSPGFPWAFTDGDLNPQVFSSGETIQWPSMCSAQLSTKKLPGPDKVPVHFTHDFGNFLPVLMRDISALPFQEDLWHALDVWIASANGLEGFQLPMQSLIRPDPHAGL